MGLEVHTLQEMVARQKVSAKEMFSNLVPPGSSIEIGCCSAIHWLDYPTVDQMINRELADFGYKYDELAEFAMPEYHMCDVDGYELTDERGDYMRKWYDEETQSTFGYTEHQGSYISTQWHDDGRTTMHWGGPCAPTTYDKYGEEC